MNNWLLEERLNGIDTIPSIPLVLKQVQKIMRNPKSNMKQIAQVVAKDQALAAKTIRLINSAYYSRGKHIASIRDAIVALGLNTLNNMMLGLSITKLFSNSKVLGFDPELFWKHSFATALTAKKIGIIAKYEEPEECFTAGLLHDIGTLIMEQFLHNDFVEAMEKANDKKSSLYLWEIEVFGFSHADTGGWLAAKWNLPAPLICSIKYHHNPGALPEDMREHSDIVRIVSLANNLCGLYKIGNSGEYKYPKEKICSVNNLTKSRAEESMKEVEDELSITLKQWDLK